MGDVPAVECPPQSTPRAPWDWGPPVFVWGLWTCLLVAQLVLVAGHAVNVPYWDDWYNVPFMTGQEPVTLGWLWDQTPGAETRTPLYRLLFVALFRVGGGDLRTLHCVNALALCTLAGAAIRVAARLRGRSAYTDAFFPCLLLHWGHAEVLLWATMIYITIPLVLVGSLLLLIVQTRRTVTLPQMGLAGLALALLPLTGTSGLAFVPFLGLWLAGSAWRAWRSGQRATAWTALGFGVATCLLTVVFFLGDYQRGDPADQSLAEQAEGGLKVLAVTLGPAVRMFWPYSGGLVPLFLLLAAAWLLWVWWYRGEERLRAAGLLLVLMAVVSLAGLLGWKRPQLWCLAVYYGTLPLLGLCAAYYAWCLYGPPTVRSFFQMCLLGLAGAMLSLNTQEGYLFSWGRHSALASVEQSILRDRMPASVLTQSYAAVVFWSAAEEGTRQFHQQLHESLRALRTAGVGAFREMPEDGPALEVQLRPKSAQPHNLIWQRGLATGEGANAWLVFPLPQAQYVNGLRIRYQHSNSKPGPSYYRFSPGLTPYFQVEWKKASQPDYAEADRYVDVENNVGPEDEQTITIWIHDTIDQIRIRPDRRPFVCRIAEIVLLVPKP